MRSVYLVLVKGKCRVDTSGTVVTDLSATEIRICQHSFVGSFA